MKRIFILVLSICLMAPLVYAKQPKSEKNSKASTVDVRGKRVKSHTRATSTPTTAGQERTFGEKFAEIANETRQRAAENASGKVEEDEYGLPVLHYRGVDYPMESSLDIHSINLNIYRRDSVSIEILQGPKERISFSPTGAEGSAFRDERNPKNVVRAHFLKGDDLEFSGCSVTHIKYINDSTVRKTTITREMAHATPQEIRERMLKDTKEIRKLNPPVVKGNYGNYSNR